MFPAASILSAGLQFAGGILQRDAVTRAYEERARQMRRRAAAERGAYTAAVGGTGVELTSSTVQNYLNEMKMESERIIREAENAGQSAADLSIISAMGGAAGSLFKGFSDVSQEAKAFGEEPGAPTPGIRKPTDAELWAWEPPTSWNPLLGK